jgi:hypothetical protein
MLSKLGLGRFSLLNNADYFPKFSEKFSKGKIVSRGVHDEENIVTKICESINIGGIRASMPSSFYPLDEENTESSKCSRYSYT